MNKMILLGVLFGIVFSLGFENSVFAATGETTVTVTEKIPGMNCE